MRSFFPILEVSAGVVLIGFLLRDAFETMILPRRLNGRLRFTSSYYRSFWPLWSRSVDRLRGRTRESALSLFGPLSMLLLFVLWATGLILSFALIIHGLGSPMRDPELLSSFGMDLYLSGSTFVTLGLGSAVPFTSFSRFLAVAEGGLGFGFVAVIISYLPILYGGFSRREASISMLDARAGSPPSASELLRRHATDLGQLDDYLAEWERWSAELLESQISYPVLGYFRSQHVNQSWLAALTTLLDACAFLIATGENHCADQRCTRQARLTFAMARHAVVDLAQIFIRQLPQDYPDRLPPATLDALCEQLRAAGLPLCPNPEQLRRLDELRGFYEPHIQGIARRLRLDPPRWLGDPNALDNWQRGPWQARLPSPADAPTIADQHF